MKVEIILKFPIEGFHSWGNALPQVAFLKDRHRHTFFITCGIPVVHLDREKEIFLERERIKKYIAYKYGNPAEFEEQSCEMIAKSIMDNFTQMDWCEVLEEQTGGAKISR